MSAWAKVGIDCICVDGGSPRCSGFDMYGQYPVTGGQYRISAVFADPNNSGKVLLHLDGLPSDPGYGWNAARFHPLVTRTQEQDLSIFLPLLETAGADA